MLGAFCLVLVAWVACPVLAAVNPASLETSAVSPNRSVVLPEVTSNNVTNGRALFLPEPLQSIRQVMLPLVVRKLGLIECAGLDHTFGGHFFQSILDPHGTEQDVDISGNYLCRPTCGGQCIPTQGLGEAPISIYYPFGCRCPAQRCDSRGPIISPLVQPVFKVVCARDERCTCDSMGPRGSQVGYICNWINLNTNLPISFLDRPEGGYHPQYSPIRWCSCCPAESVGNGISYDV